MHFSFSPFASASPEPQHLSIALQGMSLYPTSGLHPVKLPHQDSRLPPLYLADSHPLISRGHGRIIIMLLDTGIEVMASNLNAASEMELPATKDENDEKGEWLLAIHQRYSLYLFHAGFPILRPSDKDYLLVRDIKNDGNPYKDRIISWATAK